MRGMFNIVLMGRNESIDITARLNRGELDGGLRQGLSLSFRDMNHLIAAYFDAKAEDLYLLTYMNIASDANVIARCIEGYCLSGVPIWCDCALPAELNNIRMRIDSSQAKVKPIPKVYPMYRYEDKFLAMLSHMNHIYVTGNVPQSVTDSFADVEREYERIRNKGLEHVKIDKFGAVEALFFALFKDVEQWRCAEYASKWKQSENTFRPCAGMMY